MHVRNLGVSAPVIDHLPSPAHGRVFCLFIHLLLKLGTTSSLSFPYNFSVTATINVILVIVTAISVVRILLSVALYRYYIYYLTTANLSKLCS